MADSVQLPISLLAGAAVCFYGGTHLLWKGLGGHQTRYPMVRGLLLVVPIICAAIWTILIGEPGKAVAMLLTGSTLILTLALGIIAVSHPDRSGISSQSLKLLAPLAAATFIIGLSGELNLTHAIALSAIYAVLLWAYERSPADDSPGVDRSAMLGFVALTIGGTAIISLTVSKLLVLPILPLLGPVIVPLVVLGAIGLLVGDIHARNSRPAIDTVVAAVMALIGIGLPIAIVVAHTIFTLSPATTQPDAPPAIVMPIQSWRIDTVLLTVLAIMLLPVGLGRFTLGKIEGILLVLACVILMLATVGSARL